MQKQSKNKLEPELYISPRTYVISALTAPTEAKTRIWW